MTWPIPAEAANSAEWLRTTLEALVLKYANVAERPPRRTQEQVELDELTEEAAAIWVGIRTSWVPDEVVVHIEAGLLPAGWPEARISGVRDTLITAARDLREDLRADRSRLDTCRDRAAHRATRVREWRIRAEEDARAEQIRRSDEDAARRRQRIAAERQLAAMEALAEREHMMQAHNRPAPAPDPQPFGVSHAGAEHLVAMWMRHLGVLDAVVTPLSGDGGIDVVSSDFVAQVKNLTGFVPVQDVRALFGVAASESKRGLLFTSGAVTTEGLAFADRVDMALIRYDAIAGTLEGLNEIGVRAVERSIAEAWS
jgi:hypothetical protein